MGRTLEQVIAELPPERPTRVEARYRELNIRQPSVSKIEKQTDMYLSTLRNYIKAIGGELELIVKLPKRPAIRLHQLGDASGTSNSARELAVRRGESVRLDDQEHLPWLHLGENREFILATTEKRSWPVA
jgi:hypothetical protein